MSDESSVSSEPRLRRTLTLWDLLLYGIIVLQPVAPMSAFGALSDRGRGSVGLWVGDGSAGVFANLRVTRKP